MKLRQRRLLGTHQAQTIELLTDHCLPGRLSGARALNRAGGGTGQRVLGGHTGTAHHAITPRREGGSQEPKPWGVHADMGASVGRPPQGAGPGRDQWLALQALDAVAAVRGFFSERKGLAHAVLVARPGVGRGHGTQAPRC